MLYCYITCPATRGIELDIVPDALAQACIHSFKRFGLQRGYLQVVLSDNGSPSIGNNMQDSWQLLYSMEI